MWCPTSARTNRQPPLTTVQSHLSVHSLENCTAGSDSNHWAKNQAHTHSRTQCRRLSFHRDCLLCREGDFRLETHRQKSRRCKGWSPSSHSLIESVQIPYQNPRSHLHKSCHTGCPHYQALARKTAEIRHFLR